jgi:hypothetical protein
LKEGLKKGDRVVENVYEVGAVRHHSLRREGEPQKAAYDKRPLPRLLFATAGAMTLFTLMLLWRQLPDLFLRTLLWVRARGRYRPKVVGLNNFPGSGPVVLVTDADSLGPLLQVLAATDRTTRCLLPPPVDEPGPSALARWLAGRTFLATLTDHDAEKLTALSAQTLARGEALAVPLPDRDRDPSRAAVAANLLDAVSGQADVIVPVHCVIGQPHFPGASRPIDVVFGTPLSDATAAADLWEAVRRLGEDYRAGEVEQDALVGAH